MIKITFKLDGNIKFDPLGHPHAKKTFRRSRHSLQRSWNESYRMVLIAFFT